jgi:hypothetical protein
LGIRKLDMVEADDKIINTDKEKLFYQKGIVYFFLDFLIACLFFNRTVLWGDKPHLIDFYKNKQLSNNKFYFDKRNNYFLRTIVQYVYVGMKAA